MPDDAGLRVEAARATAKVRGYSYAALLEREAVAVVIGLSA